MKPIVSYEQSIFKTVRLVFSLMMLVSMFGISGNKASAASFIERVRRQ
jgi:hypothetical protein